MNCPDCNNTVRKYARFCFYCGLEMVQFCPLCDNQEVRPLHTLAPDFTLWCGKRGEIVHNCVHCGRWFAPDVLVCPDPQCRGEVRAAFPALIGQDVSGNRRLALERYQGDERLLSRLLPADWVPTPAGTWATLLAYNKRYDWTQRGFFEFSVQEPRVNLPFAATLTPSDRYDPERLAAVLGSYTILATRDAFLRVGLSPTLQTALWSDWGAPVTQAANGRYWLGWTERVGERLLLQCKAGKGAIFEPERVDLPSDARLKERGRMVLNARYAYWPGQNNTVWSLDLEAGNIEPLSTGGGEIVSLRAEETGVFAIVRETQNAPLKLSIEPLQPNRPPDTVWPASTDFVSWGASPRVLVVLTSQKALVTIRPEFADFDPIPLPQGRMLDWTIWDTGSGDPALIILSAQGPATRLRCINLRSGVITPFIDAATGVEVILQAVTRPRLAGFANQLLIFSEEGIQRFPLR